LQPSRVLCTTSRYSVDITQNDDLGQGRGAMARSVLGRPVDATIACTHANRSPRTPGWVGAKERVLTASGVPHAGDRGDEGSWWAPGEELRECARSSPPTQVGWATHSLRAALTTGLYLVRTFHSGLPKMTRFQPAAITSPTHTWVGAEHSHLALQQRCIQESEDIVQRQAPGRRGGSGRKAVG